MVTNKNKAESVRTVAAYVAEEQSDAPDAGNITVVNAYLSASTVTVADLNESDIDLVISQLTDAFSDQQSF